MEMKYSELDYSAEMMPRDFAGKPIEDSKKPAEKNMPEFSAEAIEHFSDSEANSESL